MNAINPTRIPSTRRQIAAAIALSLVMVGCTNDQQGEVAAKPPAAIEKQQAKQEHSASTELKERDAAIKSVPTQAQEALDTVAAEPSRKSAEREAPMAHYELRRQAQDAGQSVSKMARTHGLVQHARPQPATVNLAGIRAPAENVDRDNYQHQDDNPIKKVSEDPVSTFSIDVDTASYSNTRRMIMREGRLPPRDAVKAEEFINYFSYQYPTPTNVEQPFSVHTELAATPWNEKTQLLQIGLKGFEVDKSARPASNLVFLIDVSGSMRSPFKLNLVKQSLRLLVKQMDAKDRIALVVYAGAAGLVLDSTAASNKAQILAAIDALEAGGSTNGGAGIRLAYNVAQQHLIEGGINRVIIASDGDMNVGTTGMEALKDLIKEKRELGVSLTTLGYGTGNYNYALMEQLADVGNGNAAYIDSLKEAHKVLVKQLNSTLMTIAKDVKIQIEFNPEQVSEYRLIGYQNRLLKREDFLNDKIDAGEIGAGHTVTALYEIALRGSGGEKVAPLRYSAEKTQRQSVQRRPAADASELAFVKLRFKQPGGDKSREISQPIHTNPRQPQMANASNNLRFAAAVAGYAQLLRGGLQTGDWGYGDAVSLARGAKGEDADGYRGELITLVELSQSLSTGIAARPEPR